MLISVIVPTCNRNDLLEQCLNLLCPENQTINIEYELIVTDDSKDNKAKALVEEKFKWATWKSGPKNGPAANRNYGAKQAKGEWIVFIDDDCLPKKDILAQYKDALNQYPESKAFEGTILPDDWDKLKVDMSECPTNTTGGLFWSANICVKADTFAQVNGFDESFLIAAQEDQDIHLRISKLTKIIFLSEAIVIHPVRVIALSKKVRLIPIATKNWYIYERKHNLQSRSRIFSTVFRFISEFSKGAVKNLLQGKFKTAFYFIALIFSGIPVYLKLAITNYRNG